MRKMLVWSSALALLTSPANADVIIGVEWSGAVLTIDPASGVKSLIGNTGFSHQNALAMDAEFHLYTAADANLLRVDPITGIGTQVAPLSFEEPASVRGLAFSPSGVLFAINDLRPGSSDGADKLYTVDPATGQTTPVGLTGTIGLQSLEFARNGTLYGYDMSSGAPNVVGAGLVIIDPATAQCTVINPPAQAWSLQSLTFGPNGALYAIGHNGIFGNQELGAMDLSTGTATFFSGHGHSDIRGMAYIPEPAIGALTAMAATITLVRARHH